MNPSFRSHATVFAALCLSVAMAAVAMGSSIVRVDNQTVVTLCAEEDNVNVPLFAPSDDQVIRSYFIEAEHPQYPFTEDHSSADFTDCHFGASVDHSFANPATETIYDDGRTAIVAIRQEKWWQPRGMTVVRAGSQSGAEEFQDAHMLTIYRQSPAGDYPQILVLYSDGNLRLKPFAPPGRSDSVFGSSVVIGPAPVSERPVANIERVEWYPEHDRLEVRFAGGDVARLTLAEVTEKTTRLRVDARFDASGHLPFATFRSMFVGQGNADVDHARVTDVLGDSNTIPILELPSTEATEIEFHRLVVSRHNTSAPDLRFSSFRLQSVPEPAGAGICGAVVLLFLLSGLARSKPKISLNPRNFA
jgi:hypothetical protein